MKIVSTININRIIINKNSRICIISDSASKADILKANLAVIQEGLKQTDSYVAAEGEDPENIVNEINSVAPDAVFCSLESPFQERFISQKIKINARVMILVTSDMQNVREDGTINNSGFLNRLRTRVFRRQARKYEMDKES